MIQFPAMADVRPTLMSAVVVGLMAVIFILFAKFVVNKFPVPAAVRDGINAV